MAEVAPGSQPTCGAAAVVTVSLDQLGWSILTPMRSCFHDQGHGAR